MATPKPPPEPLSPARLQRIRIGYVIEVLTYLEEKMEALATRHDPQPERIAAVVMRNDLMPLLDEFSQRAISKAYHVDKLTDKDPFGGPYTGFVLRGE